jgi:hypothetical protein
MVEIAVDRQCRSGREQPARPHPGEWRGISSLYLSHLACQFGRISDSRTDDGFHKAQFPVYSWGLNVSVAAS